MKYINDSVIERLLQELPELPADEILYIVEKLKNILQGVN